MELCGCVYFRSSMLEAFHGGGRGCGEVDVVGVERRWSSPRPTSLKLRASIPAWQTRARASVGDLICGLASFGRAEAMPVVREEALRAAIPTRCSGRWWQEYRSKFLVYDLQEKRKA